VLDLSQRFRDFCGHKLSPPRYQRCSKTPGLSALPRRLKSGQAQCPATRQSAATREVGEHDLMGKERYPLDCGRAIGGGAANEFVPAVAVTDQPGVAKLANERAGGA